MLMMYSKRKFYCLVMLHQKLNIVDFLVNLFDKMVFAKYAAFFIQHSFVIDVN